MKKIMFRNLLSINLAVFSMVYAQLGNAHSAGGITMDAEGISRIFTGLAFITCTSAGNESTAYLEARIKDNSPPVEGLLVNLQLLKTSGVPQPIAVNISDAVSGDADYSPAVRLYGGNGVYYLIINKTNAGLREFDLEWHCKAASGAHTETDIGVYQFW